MRNVVAQKFTKGINARLPIDRFDADPQRLHTLQNARLSSRDGNTYYAKRIDGATPINTEQYPVVLDILGYKEFIIILFKEEENSAFHYVDIVNAANPEQKVIEEPFVYSDINTRDIGKLILLEDTILISPHNKMLNYIFGAWNFNNFVSTTPTIEANLVDVEEVGQELSFFKGEIIVKSGVLGSPPPAKPSKTVIGFDPDALLTPFTFTFKLEPTPDGEVIFVTIVFENPISASDAAQQIQDAINSDETISAFWVVEIINNTIVVRLKESVTNQEGYDKQYNDLSVSITISPDTEEESNIDIRDVFTIQNQTDCAFQNDNEKCAKTFDGRAAGSFGRVMILLGQRTPIFTRDFVFGETADDINAEIFEKVSESLIIPEIDEELQDYQVDTLQDGDFYITSIKAKKEGLEYNLTPINVVFFDTNFFVVSTKIVNAGLNIVEGDFDTTKKYWYKARNVYFDGHKTKTCFPVYSKAEKITDNVELKLTPDRDIDGTYTDIEIFRKSDDGDFYFIKKIKPQDVDPTQDYYVEESQPAYRYIYTRSQNFPAPETKTIAFTLGEYRTGTITLEIGDTEEVFIQKIYDAFLALESFTSKWSIKKSTLPRGIEISSAEISMSYNNIPLVPNSDTQNTMVRGLLTTLGEVLIEQTNTDQIQIQTLDTTSKKLFQNDVIRITALNGLTQDFTVATDYEITETQKIIPIKETIETITANSVISFVSGEVFSDYALIRSVNISDPSIKFYDTGFKDLYVLDERDYIWSRHHYTHEVARDRYVRANVDYDLIEDIIPEFQFTLEEVPVLPQENTSPFFTNGTLFAQARFQDGTTSFFEEIGSFSTETESESFFVQQNDVSDENVKEYAFYAQYKPKNNPFIELNAASFSNALLPTEFTSKYLKGEDGKYDYRRQPLFPLNPRFFVGFGRVKIIYDGVGGKYEYFVPRTSVYEWILDEEDDDTELYKIGERISEVSVFFPQKQTISYFGLTLEYVLERVDGNTGSYILLPLLGIQSLIESVNLFYEIQDFKAASGGFGGVTKDEITNRKYRILAYELVKNTEADNDQYDGALFIRVESNTPLDRVQAEIRKKKRGFPPLGEFDFDEHQFNLKFLRGDVTITYPEIKGRIVGMAVDETNIFGVDEKIESAIYLGSKLNEINVTPIQLRTGYDTDKRTFNFTQTLGDLSEVERSEVNVYFSTVQVGNIYASVFLESDIPYQKEKYPNQIIWSDPFVLNSNASGYRNFRPNAFLNIGADYGKIVGIEYVNNRLLVFTEHGLAVVNVGEVLTQQIGGQVFVDSSGFLNGYAWALKELPMVMPKTIVQYENMVFFCDGQDVWMYDGELKNISQGAVILSGLGFGGDSGSGAGVFMGSTDIYWGETSRYMGEDGSPLGQDGVSTLNAWVGAIDPYNKEYRITDSFSTYAYSIEFNEWFGPYTYKDQASDSLKNRMYSVVDGRLVRQNEGTLFVETPYETTIESVANLLDRPDAVKNWRKFYVDFEVNGLEPSQYNSNFINFESYGINQPTPLGENRVLFGYRKHKYIPFEIVDLALAKVKNNSYNVGIVSSQQNSEKLYWRISTSEPEFALKMVAFEYTGRDRR